MRTRQTKEETRQTILERAYEMYRDGGLDRTDVKVATVLKDLGYTTGAAYYIWPNQAEFRREFMIHMAENIEYGTLRALQEDIAELNKRDLTFRQRVLLGGDAYIDNFLGQEDFFISLRFYEMLHPPKEIRTAVSLAYEAMQGHVVAYFEGLLARYGKRMRDESVYGVNEIVVSGTAMVEGFALRHRFQPEKIERTIVMEDDKHYLFSVNMLAMFDVHAVDI